VVAAGIVAVVSAATFAEFELRRRAPLFDVRALCRRNVAAGAIAHLCLYVGTLGGMFLLPQYLLYVRHESVFVASLTLAPAGAATLLVAPFSARVCTALGNRPTLAGSLLLDAAGFALLLFLGGGASVPLVVISMVVLGTVIALGGPVATVVIMDDLGEAKAGDGGAINQLSRQVGGALGVAIVGSVFAAVYATRVDQALNSFPSASRERASKSIEEAQEVISRVAGAAHAHLLARITHAFDVGAHAGFAVIVAVLLAASLAVVVALRRPPVRR
jgi:predicted MFS family arabinose efflux permease